MINLQDVEFSTIHGLFGILNSF